MICFISGGITNVPDYITKFAAAENELKTLGFVPFNPAAMTLPLLLAGVDLSHDQWLEIDFAALKQCNALYHLLGWEKSSGAIKEHDFATEHSIPIFYQKKYDVYKNAGLTPNELITIEKAGGFRF